MKAPHATPITAPARTRFARGRVHRLPAALGQDPRLAGTAPRRSRCSPAFVHGLLALLALGACDRPYDGPPVTWDDSAGVRISEAHLPVWDDTTRWRLDPKPLLDLHGHSALAAHAFSRVRGMRWLPDGSIAIANTGTGEVRLFSSTGDFLASAGGEGDEPGEFARMRRMELVGDSIFVLDTGGRVTVFGPGPALIRTMTLQEGIESLHSPDDGTLVAEVTFPVPEPDAPGFLRAPRALLRFDMGGAQLDSIEWTAGNETYTDFHSFAGTSLFPKRSQMDTRAGKVYYGSADVMEVRAMSPGGELLRIFRIPHYPLELSGEEIEAEREARVAGAPEFARAGLENAPAPPTRPAYSDLLVDPTGAIWLRPYVGAAEANEPTDWLVLDAEGTWLGYIEVPANFRIWDIRMDAVLGTWVDEEWAQHPQVLRLRR